MSDTFITKAMIIKSIKEELDKFEGIFQFTADPSKLKRVGRLTIHLDGVPKEE